MHEDMLFVGCMSTSMGEKFADFRVKASVH